MPEKKFFNRHMQLTMLNTSTPNQVNDTATAGWTDPITTLHGLTNRWVAFRYDPIDPLDLTNLYAFADNQATPTATDAEGRGYNDSPFALTIPQGVATGERIGRDVSVVRDSWFFRFTFPRMIPGNTSQVTLAPGTLNHQRFAPLCCVGTLTGGNRDEVFCAGLPVISWNLTQRPIRVRLVGIFEKNCDSPGEFGFTTSELFESQFDIHSRFSSDQAQGYKIVFDQTKVCTIMDNLALNSTAQVDPTAQDDKASAGPFDVSFKARIPPYLRRYEGVTSPDAGGGSEVQVSGGIIGGGVSKGALTWYMFVEDIYCPQHLNAAAPGGIASHVRYQTPEIINLEIDRKTQWIDP